MSDRTTRLKPTALINEAYLRLLARTLIGRVASTLLDSPQMSCVTCWSIMHEHTTPRCEREALSGLRLKRDSWFPANDQRKFIALHDALIHREGVGPRQAKVVELRYFGGFSVEEIGEILEMSPRSVKRHWALARIWLLKHMEKPLVS